MRVISVFSMIILTISIWALFFTVFFIGDDNLAAGEQIHTELEVDHIADDVPEQNSHGKPQHQNQENAVESEEDDVPVEKVDEKPEIEKVVKTDTKPHLKLDPTAVPVSLIERASSPYNDILYEFEKDNPISVDYLLHLINLN